jgi:methanogenic corrinoid protein MtbC1
LSVLDEDSMSKGNNRMPRFNLNVVVRETGIKADTLRAWEQRYGLPQPERSAGGHRLYSQDDLDTIHWLASQTRDRGMRISRAVDLWRKIERSGGSPIVASSATEPGQRFLTPAPDAHTLASLRTSWVDACLAFDEGQGERIINESFAYYSLETVTTDILLHGLSTIGSLWYEGTASVQQEHFTTELIMRRLHTLIAASPPPFHRSRIVIASPPKELHTVPALLLTLLLRNRGWEAIYLGADVPEDQFTDTSGRIKPDLVISSATRLETVATLRDIALELENQKTKVAYGGRIFNALPNLTKRIPGHFLGTNLNDAIPRIERLLREPWLQGDSIEASAEASQVASAFEDVKPVLDARIHTWATDAFNQESVRGEMRSANDQLGRDLLAAVSLSEIDSIATTIAWLGEFLAHRGIAGANFKHYLTTYRDTTSALLGDRGRPITAWLSDYLQESSKGVS